MSEERNDVELLEAWRAGDNAAGSRLVRRHFDALYRFFSSKAAGHEEDLAQQTFMAITEGKHEFRGDSTFRAYLFGLARFHLLTHYRKKYRSPELDSVPSSLCDVGTSPTGALARREEHQLLQLALQQLPLDQRIALELTYHEELTLKEIAHVLDVPHNTVHSRIHRAKKRLREELSRLTDESATSDRAFALLAPDEA